LNNQKEKKEGNKKKGTDKYDRLFSIKGKKSALARAAGEGGVVIWRGSYGNRERLDKSQRNAVEKLYSPKRWGWEITEGRSGANEN